MDTAQLKQELAAEAAAQGFDLLRVASPDAVLDEVRHHEQWLARGHGGDMHYLYRDPPARYDPRSLLPGCRSVMVLAASYHSGGEDPQAGRGGRVARYAWVDNYHNVLRPRLKSLGHWLDERVAGHSWRATVDSSPLAEKAFAVAAGIGMRGRNSLVVSREIGSYFFLGCVLSSATLPADDPVDYDCGTCTRCITACPQDALTGPGILMAERCISYITTERKQPPDGSEQLQDWLMGCDTCQQVCPYNDTPLATSIDRFAVRPELRDLRASEIISMNEDDFAGRFHGSVFIRRKQFRVRAAAEVVVRQSRD